MPGSTNRLEDTNQTLKRCGCHKKCPTVGSHPQVYIAALDPQLPVYDAATLQPLRMPDGTTQVSLAQSEHHKWFCCCYRPAALQGDAGQGAGADAVRLGNCDITGTVTADGQQPLIQHMSIA